MNKNAREKLFLETAYLSIYNPRLLAEKAVDGKLMCSKDCCGSPVMECKCGDDCPHCNCFMIQKAVKDFGLKSPLLEANDTVVVTRNYPADDPHSTHNTRISKKDLEKFKKMGYKIKSEDGEDYVRLTKGSTFNVTNVNVPKEDKELIDHYMKKGFKEVKPSEDNELEALIAAEDAEDTDKDEDKLVKVDDETKDTEYFSKNTPL